MGGGSKAGKPWTIKSWGARSSLAAFIKVYTYVTIIEWSDNAFGWIDADGLVVSCYGHGHIEIMSA